MVADAEANPAHVAADLLSQAEHDRLSSAVLVCDSMALAEAVAAEIERQLALLPREEIARASIEKNGKIIVADDLREGVAIANELGARAFGTVRARPVRPAGRGEERGQHFPGPLCARGAGRLLRRAEPHAAHAGHPRGLPARFRWTIL